MSNEIDYGAYRSHNGVSIDFKWTGGMYIDVSYNGNGADVINVLDYSTGENRLLCSSDPAAAFVAEVNEYMKDTEYLEEFIRNVAFY